MEMMDRKQMTMDAVRRRPGSANAMQAAMRKAKKAGPIKAMPIKAMPIKAMPMAPAGDEGRRYLKRTLGL